MATSDRELMFQALAEAERRHGSLPEVDWETPEDLSRLSLESFVQSRGEDVRHATSRGQLRLSGAGVIGHSAPLADVAALSGAWQKAVSAVAASLEGFTSVRGKLKSEIQRRSELVLTAAPAPGSLILTIEPKASPMAEVEPNGQPAMLDRNRPLADKASERLVTLLEHLGKADPGESVEQVAAEMRELGPRVASAVRGLAKAVETANVKLETAWVEPERATVRSAWTASEAKWVHDFVDGRDLDAEEVEVEGLVVTVSAAQRWCIEGNDEVTYFLDPSELSPEVVHSVKVHDQVKAVARMAVREQADGTQRAQYTLRSVEVVDEAEDTLL